MSKTLNFGSRSELRLSSRIDKFVVRRRTSTGYDRAAELAHAEYSRQVAFDVSPGQRSYHPMGSRPLATWEGPTRVEVLGCPHGAAKRKAADH
jgi:hypothetical protein